MTKLHGETYDTVQDTSDAFGQTKSFNVEELKVHKATLYVNISSFVASCTCQSKLNATQNCYILYHEGLVLNFSLALFSWDFGEKNSCTRD